MQPTVPSVQPVVNQFQPAALKANRSLLAAVIVVILAGVGTGWFLSSKTSLNLAGTGSQHVAPGAKQGVTEAGIADEKSFPDTATGVLEEGGIGGEGTHHLVRDGGPSQTVYLTSTVIDLSSFKGKKVQVWGQTITAKKAGWLMDVGKIKAL